MVKLVIKMKMKKKYNYRLLNITKHIYLYRVNYKKKEYLQYDKYKIENKITEYHLNIYEIKRSIIILILKKI